MSVSCIGLQDCFYSHYMHLFVYVCVFMRACVRACVSLRNFSIRNYDVSCDRAIINKHPISSPRTEPRCSRADMDTET